MSAPSATAAAASDSVSSAAKDIQYLQSLNSVRETCTSLLKIATDSPNGLPHFDVHLEAIPAVLSLIETTMLAKYPEGVNSVPFHSRWRHFEPNNPHRISQMTDRWTDVDAIEKARRLIDLVLVSVLLDAGAGNAWSYQEKVTTKEETIKGDIPPLFAGSRHSVYTRSEGLGIASLAMFQSGVFAREPASQPHRVDAQALLALPSDAVASHFQVTETNPLVGCAGRTALLQRLGSSLIAHPEYFKHATDGSIRPGNLVDYLLTRATTHCASSSSSFSSSFSPSVVSTHVLWEVLMVGLDQLWPQDRTALDGVNLGDVWPHRHAPSFGSLPSLHLVTFHKLSQWIQYSMMEPLETFVSLTFSDLQDMTGLPEYRNGGLFVDLGLLVPKDPLTLTRAFEPSDEVIVEWRALTVGLLDVVHAAWCTKFNVTALSFPLVKLLEAGTWAAGRVVAQSKRGGPPPIEIISDGTVF